MFSFSAKQPKRGRSRTNRSALTLTVVEGPFEGLVLEARTARVTVGRTAVNNLKLKESTVSERHAVFEWKDEAWHLKDLGSSNGSKLDGVDLQEGEFTEVKDGGLVQFGLNIKVQVSIKVSMDLSISVENFLRGLVHEYTQEYQGKMQAMVQAQQADVEAHKTIMREAVRRN